MSMLTRKRIANDGIVAAGRAHPLQPETRGSSGNLGNTTCRTICVTFLSPNIFIEGSLEVKLPTIWTDGKAEVMKSQRGEAKK